MCVQCFDVVSGVGGDVFDVVSPIIAMGVTVTAHLHRLLESFCGLIRIGSAPPFTLFTAKLV